MSADNATTAPESIYALPGELRQALLNYLHSRPYGEVAQGVQALMTLKPVSQVPTGCLIVPAVGAATLADEAGAPPINDG